MPAAKSPAPEALVDSWGRRNRKHAAMACAECGSSFYPRRKASRFCSTPCARRKNGGQNAKLQSWWTNGRGYIEGRILTAQGQRRVKQHRFVMECALGRRLRPSEDVHHRNEIKTDNRLENLELLSHSDHATLTNNGRTYTRGKKIKLSDAERQRRRESGIALARKFGPPQLRAALSRLTPSKE